MKIRVLGSGAGGGFPQWNCNCDNCRRLRHNDINAKARTQSSIAVSTDDTNWLLINASPDIRTQLETFPAIQPKQGIRDTGIKAIMLMDSQIDHTTGLLILREGEPLDIYCSEMVRQDLTTGFPLFNMLADYCTVNHHPIPVDGSGFEIAGIDDLRFYTHALKSKAPPYSPHRHDPHDGDNVGVIIEQISTGKKVYYSPGLGAFEPHVMRAMEAADCLLVDGTFWTDDEMICQKAGIKRAQDMGHLAQSGPGGMLETLNTIDNTRKILIHINNTNPILDEDSEQRQILDQAGIEVAYDGLEIEL
ncbi:MAG TPA: pyrroloquinoline quinone biosynthesis protein PqqB [Methylococcaceae bacterium]|jgi:pyrroloquinoline quinone biosynthesis protein B|nr:pyrroloquinoline quinone biosynthesis protein PqqB [Methylococcaceae bacterium]HIN69144.1 pyrroloquinoline quinone biosynthesis protein PqqB [Methylococcales bacterium]HIA45127.1 pyrroloquinoline quinone biosynthesis protein PqqB [Methylococcaceae bacterium]HIB61562.1 pyrroloquinoline quinone biosynthesis protein PqqB [Methylococcaceae bacterium]HIO13559.1 pyrroloquinoline quinone biosynthesis protein PqqB [Methylococcales bacterium]